MFVHTSHEARGGRPISRTHASQIWACDFLQVTDLFFRPLFAFFIIELQSRKVIHVGVTRSPSDAWVAQHLREATPFGQAPKYLIRDNDSKFGSSFARVATTSGIEILKTPVQAPRANAICERFMRSVRQECLDHLLLLHEKQHEPRTQYVCDVLQPGTTASRDPVLPSDIVDKSFSPFQRISGWFFLHWTVQIGLLILE
jgi:transposase InsO family protein